LCIRKVYVLYTPLDLAIMDSEKQEARQKLNPHLRMEGTQPIVEVVFLNIS